MANQISMVQTNKIITLCEQGFSQREVARRLGIHRQTVSRYVRLVREQSKSAIVPPGSEIGGGPKSTISPPGSAGRQSQCEPYRQIICDKLGQGLSGQRIFQDLQSEQGFTGSYDSVKRFVRRLGQTRPLPYRRMECPPGQEAQVDFGTGAPVWLNGKRKRTYVFRMVLSHSRKAYSESVFHQTTESFLRCLENAFWHFGGVPQTLVIDNLKAAVTRADWYDPELNPKLQSFCVHYRTVILPARPYTPRHKGKVESGIKYVQDNALKGRIFSSLAEQNRFLQDWEVRVADTRIHGTMRQQVRQIFDQADKPALLPLPSGHFPSFQESQRRVHRDGHVEVAKAYYSVPPEYLGHPVWARWDGRVVRIYNHRMESIATHAQVEAGKFQTNDRHIDARKRSGVEKGSTWLLTKVRYIGPETLAWAEALLEFRGITAVRALMGLLSLSKQYDHPAINQACRIALTHGAFRLRTLRDLLKRGTGIEQPQFDFIEEHPIIRPLSEYDQCLPSVPAAHG